MSNVTYEQATENARLVKADVARAKIYLTRGDVLKSVDAMISALTAKLAVPLAGNDRNVIEPQMAEFCDDFNHNLQVGELLGSMDFQEKVYVKYRPGLDRKVLNKFAVFKYKRLAMVEEAELAAQRERRAKYEEMVAKGKELLGTDQAPKGRSTLKRAAEQFGSWPGVLVEIGTIMVEADLTGDAMDLFKQAIELFPKDPTAYKPYIDACIFMGRNEEAEEGYKSVLKAFGGHPQTYLNMSKFYIAWRKNELAYDHAKMALDMDPELAEAKEIVARFG